MTLGLSLNTIEPAGAGADSNAQPISPFPPRLPGAPSGSSVTAPFGGLTFFGFAALLVAALLWAARAPSRILEGASGSWRPTPFVSLLERPG
jgi:hypothetical protein